MNIYDTAHKLAEEIKRSDECVQLAELRERGCCWRNTSGCRCSSR